MVISFDSRTPVWALEKVDFLTRQRCPRILPIPPTHQYLRKQAKTAALFHASLSHHRIIVQT